MTWTAEQHRKSYHQFRILEIMEDYGFSEDKARRCIEFNKAVEAYVESQFPSNAPDKPTTGDLKACRKWTQCRGKVRKHIRTKKMNSGEWDDVKPYIEKKWNIKPSSKAGMKREEVRVGLEPLNSGRMAPSKLPASTSSKAANKGTPANSRPAPQGGGIEPDAKRRRKEPAPANEPPKVNEKELAPAPTNSACRQQMVLVDKEEEHRDQLHMEKDREDEVSSLEKGSLETQKKTDCIGGRREVQKTEGSLQHLRALEKKEQDLIFEQDGELQILKAEQERKLQDLKAEQERELQGIRQEIDVEKEKEIKRLREEMKKQEEELIARERAFEEEQIARERAFEEEQIARERAFEDHEKEIAAKRVATEQTLAALGGSPQQQIGQGFV